MNPFENEHKKGAYAPEHINYALVEDTRPPMYKAMKYWGRKPHNIWGDYIQHYCPEGGVVLDPFVGSGISTFECLKKGHKIISTDLNPLSSFVIEVLASKFDEDKFAKAVTTIENTVRGDAVYQEHFQKNIEGKIFTVYNYVWNENMLKLVRVKAHDNKEGASYSANEEDERKAHEMGNIEIPYWYPTDVFPKNPSINHNFIEKIGGNTFDCLWTRRNLYVLAKIFDLIQKADADVQLHLMYAFIHTLHLVCKMVVPRGEAGNRDFSGSWGRADYMIRKRSMEQNPLVVFLRSCFDRQGVVKAMRDARKTLPAKKRLNFINTRKKINLTADVNYGVLDVADLCDYIEENSIDFILTDPPYGGLVQYMDLSLVWLVWLQHFDAKYIPDASGEITYKKGIISRDSYRQKLNRAFKNMYKVLKPQHYLVVTFHNQDIKEWNDFVGAIHEAGFVFEKVTHQYNRRSGESNVANPYGTTGSDFYIRCKKTTDTDVDHDRMELDRFVLQRTISILIERAEPTPFTFILNGLLPDMLQAGYLQPEEPADELYKILSTEIGDGKIFRVEKNKKDQSGDNFWFNVPSDYINHRNIPLAERVDLTVKSLMRRKVSVRYDDVIAEIFREYPNGQTPDPRSIVAIVEKYAIKSSGKWKLKDEVEHDCTVHSRVIHTLCRMARQARFEPFVGKREQREFVDDKARLAESSAYIDLDGVLDGYDELQLSRIEMMDNVWIRDGKIAAIFEVENSTDFIGALGRASNVDVNIPKFMVIPEKRVHEFLSYQDPMFVNSFKETGWHYLTYEDLRILNTARVKTIDLFVKTAKTL